jgi:tyrosine-specific transport protein
MGYASVVAYAAGGGLTIASFINSLFGTSLEKVHGIIIYIFLFGLMVSVGSKFVGRINALMVAAMVGSFGILVGIGLPLVKGTYLTHIQWTGFWTAIPIFLTSFSFQAFIVPSLATYLDKDAVSLKKAIVYGMLLNLAVYVIWQLLVLGSVPVEGEYGLKMALAKGEPVSEYLKFTFANPLVGAVCSFFAFFALSTSFLGIGLGLFDFLADAFKIQKKGWGMFSIGAMIIIPTLIFSLGFERAFLVAMDTTGGFGDTILNGMLPVLMVWSLRKNKSLAEKIILGSIFGLFAIIFIIEICAVI